MKTFIVTIDVFVQADHATEAMDILGSEMDDICEQDNAILAVQYPPTDTVKEEGEDEDNSCQICGEDGGTSCGAVNCGY